jgi:hypothetical protein
MGPVGTKLFSVAKMLPPTYQCSLQVQIQVSKLEVFIKLISSDENAGKF